MPGEWTVTHLALDTLELSNVGHRELAQPARLTKGGGVAAHALWVLGLSLFY